MRGDSLHLTWFDGSSLYAASEATSSRFNGGQVFLQVAALTDETVRLLLRLIMCLKITRAAETEQTNTTSADADSYLKLLSPTCGRSDTGDDGQQVTSAAGKEVVLKKM